MKANSDRNKRYVVLVRSVGRLKPGIHFKECLALPKSGEVFVRTGDVGIMVPQDIVFKTQSEAQLWAAQRGKRMWVVEKQADGSPKIYEAFVNHTYTYGRYGSRTWVRCVTHQGRHRGRHLVYRRCPDDACTGIAHRRGARGVPAGVRAKSLLDVERW